MAIYKNRTVSVSHVIEGDSNPSRIIVKYPDGSLENAKLGEVVLTEDEKKSILDNHTDTFSNQLKTVNTSSDTYKGIQEDKKRQEDFKKNEVNLNTSPVATDLIKTDAPKTEVKTNSLSNCFTERC